MSNKQPYIVWTEELKTDFPTIDNQHKKIIDIANSLHSSLGSENLQELINIHLNQLKRYSAVHFGFEEKILQDHNYFLLKEHICLHDAFVGQLIKLEKKFSSLAKNSPNILVYEEVELFAWKVIKFVSQWWLHHILVEDKKYMNFLQKIADTYESDS
ncbi:MAG: bacteriohemerythrin [Desulfocapsaceae bacterium]|nr:bacteriohemerythrin [Desulfocapsaceae bacterium]